jgi:hypothetical protein
MPLFAGASPRFWISLRNFSKILLRNASRNDQETFGRCLGGGRLGGRKEIDRDEAKASRPGGWNSAIPAPTRTHEKEELPCKQVV